MVFEVTYIEPQIAAATVLAQASSPLFGDVRITPLGPAGANATQAAGQLVRFSALVSDTNGSLLRESQRHLHQRWDQLAAPAAAAEPHNRALRGHASARQAAGAEISAFFESLDNAGNVAVETRKGTLASIEYSSCQCSANMARPT